MDRHHDGPIPAYLYGYTWVSFRLEVVSWRLRATCRAARVAYPVVGWMLLDCCRRRSGYYRAATRRRELALPFGRGPEERIKYFQCAITGVVTLLSLIHI